MKRPLLIFIANLCPMLCACGAAPINIRVEPSTRRPEKCAIIFFADGLNLSTLIDLLGQGRLPTIAQRFIRDGVRFHNAVDNLPAMTYPNTVSMLTGCFVGRHGIAGNEWFDRTNLRAVDYITFSQYLDVDHDFSSLTIYELLEDHFTANILCPTHRGATMTIHQDALSGPAYALGMFKQIDQYSAGRLRTVADEANKTGVWPSLITFYFSGTDEIGHRHGSGSSEYKEAVENVDRQINRVIHAIEDAGLAQRTYYVLLTDHSHLASNPDHILNLTDWLQQHRGLRVQHGEVKVSHDDRHRENISGVDAVVLDGSHRSAAISLRGTDGWTKPPPSERVRELLEGPATDANRVRLSDLSGVALAIARRNHDCVEVYSRRGDALVERNRENGKTRFRYTPIASPKLSQPDPLIYRQSPALSKFIDAGWHESREWLEATANAEFPDFVPQAACFFDAQRAGDLVLFAEDDWSFDGIEPGIHGSCIAKDMLIPLFFAGPDLPKGAVVEQARLVDVLPTLLDLLGEGKRTADAPAIDGISIASQLRNAGRDGQ